MLMCRKYLLGASALVEAVTLAGFYAPGQLDVIRQVVQYDLNGNATRIVRSACATSINPGVVASMDDVSMSYRGNRLVKAVDQGEEMLFERVMDFPGEVSEYGYDSDGRMISDSGRDIEQITYSPDGHPLGIYFTDGSCLLYTYSADGQRLQETYSNSSESIYMPTPTFGDRLVAFYHHRYYIGGFEMTLDIPEGYRVGAPGSSAYQRRLDRINLPWGYTDAQGSFFTYVNDYQGNVRAVVNSKGEAVQTNDYYPDGTLISTSTGQQLNRRKFGGKELETRSALNTYDQQARQYFAPSLRFDNPDPLAGNRPSESPYIFCANNPVNYIDPDGRKFVLAGENPDKEKEIIEYMKHIAGESSAFNLVYTILDTMKTEIKIKYGSTKISDGANEYDVPSGYFDCSTNTIAYDNNRETPNALTIAEESYHALQNFASLSCDKNENKEFEAKVFACMVAGQSGAGGISIPGMSKFSNMIYDRSIQGIMPFSIKQYLSTGKQFSNFYREYASSSNMAMRNYSYQVSKLPTLLCSILILQYIFPIK